MSDHTNWPTCPLCGMPHQLVAMHGVSTTQPQCSCPVSTTTTTVHINTVEQDSMTTRTSDGGDR